MALAPEVLYRQLGLLLSQVPDFNIAGVLSEEHARWLGRTFALVEQDGNFSDVTSFRTHMDLLNTATRRSHANHILVILHRVLARAELQAPVAAQGAFVNVGEEFSAYQAVAKVLSTARQSVLLVDPYLSVDVLFDFAPTAAENVGIRLLVDGQRQALIEGLRAGTQRWQAQFGQTRPLDVRQSQPRQLHDRLIVIDEREAWTLTQSFKDLADRSPASLLRADGDVASAKLAAYGDIWAQAQPI